MPIDKEDLDNRFSYHPPTVGKAEAHARLRDLFRTVAGEVVHLTPTSREQSLAITALEEALMWANAAIARNPEKD